MSSIDERVVEMQFENADFEKGINESIKSLQELKKHLNFDGAVKGLNAIEKLGSKFSLSGVEANVQKIADSFSTLGVIGINVLSRISNAAIDFGMQIFNNTVMPIRSGFQEYETQINAIQTILANTSSKGTTLDQVNTALDELNKYADMTIYNFTQMTKNIGTFTAAGVDLDTSVAAIKGIANLAAVSGSNSQQASVAMYQLSQALASGTVKLQDWNSVVNAGMGGEVFQNALKETARVHGIAIDQMIKDEGSFRETLHKGWLSTDLLLETLQKFTGDLSEEQLRNIGYTEDQIKAIMELGKTANDAATKVKTFTQLFDTLNEALQSGWTQSWEILIGDFEEAKELLTSISDTLSDIINKDATKRNSMLEQVFGTKGKKSVSSSSWKAFSEASSNAEMLQTKLIELAREHGIAIDKMMQDEGSFEATLKNGWLSSDLLNEALGASSETFSGETKAFEDYKQVVAEIWQGQWGTGTDRFEKLAEAGYDWQKVQELVNATQFTDGVITWEELTDEQREFFSNLDKNTGEFSELNQGLMESDSALTELLDSTVELSGRQKVIEGFKNIWLTLVDVFGKVSDAWSTIFPDTTAQTLTNIIDKFYEWSKTLSLTVEQNGYLRRIVMGFASALDIGLNIIKAVIAGVKQFLDTLPKGNNSLIDRIDKFARKITDLRSKLKDGEFFSNITKGIFDFLRDIGGFIKSVKEDIFALFSGEAPKFKWIEILGKWIGKIKESIKKINFKPFSKFLDTAKNFVKNIFGGGKETSLNLASALSTIFTSFNPDLTLGENLKQKIFSMFPVLENLNIPFLSDIENAFDAFITWFTELDFSDINVEDIKNAILSLLPHANEDGTIEIPLFTAIHSAFDSFVSWISNLNFSDISADDVKNAVLSIIPRVNEDGKVEVPFLTGIHNAFDEFVNWLLNLEFAGISVEDIKNKIVALLPKTEDGNVDVPLFTAIHNAFDSFVTWISSLSFAGISVEDIKNVILAILPKGNEDGTIEIPLFTAIHSAFDSFVSWISNFSIAGVTAEDIKNKVLALFPNSESEETDYVPLLTNIQNAFGNFIDWLKNLDFSGVDTEGISNFFSTIWDSFFGFLGKIKDFAGEKIGEIPNMLEAVGGIFGNNSDDLGDAEEKKSALTVIFEGLVNALSEFAEKIGPAFERVKLALGDFVGDITFKDILDFLTQVLSTIGTLAVAGGVSVIAQNINMVGEYIEQWTGGDKYINLRNIAISLLALSGALYMLSQIDADKLGPVFASLGGLIFSLMGAVGIAKLLAKISGFGAGFVVAEMIAISLAIGIMAFIATQLAEIEVGDLAKGVIATGILGLIGIGLVALASIIKGGKATLSAFGMIVMSIAIGIMAGIAIIFSTMDVGALAKGIIATGFLGLIGVGLFALLSLINGAKGIFNAAGMLVMAVAVGIMAIIAGIFGTMEVETLAKGIIATGFLGLIGVGLFALLSLINGAKGIFNAAGMIIMAVAIGIMAIIAGIFGTMEVESLAKGIIATGFLGLIGIGLFALLSLINGAKGIFNAAGMIVMAVAIGIMALITYLLSGIELGDLVKGVAAVGFLGLIGTGLFALLGTVKNGLAAGLNAVGMIFMVIAVGIMAMIAAKLSEIELGDLFKGIIAVGLLGLIAVGLSALMGVGGGKGKVGGGVLNLKGGFALLLVAGAIGVLGWALGELCKIPARDLGERLLIIAGALGELLIAGAIAGIQPVATGLIVLSVAILAIGIAAALVTAAFAYFIDVLGNLYTKIQESGEEDPFEAFSQFIEDFITSLSNHAEAIGKAGWNLASGLIVGFFKGIGESIASLASNIGEQFSQLWSSIVRGLTGMIYDNGNGWLYKAIDFLNHDWGEAIKKSATEEPVVAEPEVEIVPKPIYATAEDVFSAMDKAGLSKEEYQALSQEFFANQSEWFKNHGEEYGFTKEGYIADSVPVEVDIEPPSTPEIPQDKMEVSREEIESKIREYYADNPVAAEITLENYATDEALLSGLQHGALSMYGFEKGNYVIVDIPVKPVPKAEISDQPMEVSREEIESKIREYYADNPVGAEITLENFSTDEELLRSLQEGGLSAYGYEKGNYILTVPVQPEPEIVDDDGNASDLGSIIVDEISDAASSGEEAGATIEVPVEVKPINVPTTEEVMAMIGGLEGSQDDKNAMLLSYLTDPEAWTTANQDLFSLDGLSTGLTDSVDTAISDAVDGVDYDTMSTNLGDGMSNAMAGTEDAMSEAGAGMMGAALTGMEEEGGIASPSKKTYAMGIFLGMGLGLGVLSSMPIVNTSIEKMMQSILDRRTNIRNIGLKFAKTFVESAATGLTMYKNILLKPFNKIEDEFKRIATACADGFVNGLAKEEAKIRIAAEKVARLAHSSTANELEVASPSKKYERIGMYSDIGLANGLTKYSYLVRTSAKDLGKDATNALSNTLQSISEIVENDIDLHPVISPVIDLNDAKLQAAKLSSMMRMNSVINANKTNAIYTEYARLGRLQVENSNSDVVSAINNLNGHIDSQAEALSGLQVVMNTGALVGQLKRPLDRRLGEMAGYRERGI